MADTCQWSLTTISWRLTLGCLPCLIWALKSFPNLQSVEIQLDSASTGAEDDDEEKSDEKLGAAGDISLSLPKLQCFSIDTLSSPSTPDVEAFLATAAHGAKLIFQDINTVTTPAELPHIVDLCPLLQTFTFSADWRLEPRVVVSPSGSGATTAEARITNAPHQCITAVGLHGLSYSLIPSTTTLSEQDPLHPLVTIRANELVVRALNRVNFPNLRLMRALSRTLLR
jgi:hypothetical protein